MKYKTYISPIAILTPATLSMVRLSSAVLIGIGLTPPLAAESRPSVDEKQVIGPTAMVEESESDFVFPARVDTGATTTSLHVEDMKVDNELPEMEANVGKTIRFCLKNERGEKEWIQRKIAEISVIKTSEDQEVRYKVPLTLNCQQVKKKVLVSLNDRSHMTYPALLGRNFLENDFVVDVALKPNAEKDGESNVNYEK